MKVRKLDKMVGQQELLDAYIKQFIEATRDATDSKVHMVPGRRFLSVEGEGQDSEILQHHTAIYAENVSNSFLITLTNTHLMGGTLVDITVANIKQVFATALV